MEYDREYQLLHLNAIFRYPLFTPIFLPNPKYCIGEYENVGGYIAWSDLTNQRVIVRVVPPTRLAKKGAFADDMTPVFQQYDSIEHLVDDGWCLDWAEPWRESDRDYQIRNLSKIYREQNIAPEFRPNPKYSPKDFNPAWYSMQDIEGAARGYIALSDIMNELYIVRDAHLDGAIVKQYGSIEELVDDVRRRE